MQLWPSCRLRAYAEEKPDENGITKPSITTNLPSKGDPYGWRKSLADLGITYTFIYINDVLGNVSGGLQRGAVDQGTFEAQLTLDMEKLAGWKDFTIYTNGVGIYNTGRIRRDYVGGINTIAGIEAAPSVRLLQLWGEQTFSNDKVSIRFGQLVADSEFMVSDLFFCKATGRQSPHRTCRAAAQPFRCRRRASASK